MTGQTDPRVQEALGWLEASLNRQGCVESLRQGRGENREGRLT